MQVLCSALQWHLSDIIDILCFLEQIYSIFASAKKGLVRPAGQMTIQDPVPLKWPQQIWATCIANCTTAECASWGEDCISARTVRDELSAIGQRAGWPVRPPLLTPPKTSHLTVWGQTEATIDSSAVASGPDEPVSGQNTEVCWCLGLNQSNGVDWRSKHGLHYKDVISLQCSYHKNNPPEVSWCSW